MTKFNRFFNLNHANVTTEVFFYAMDKIIYLCIDKNSILNNYI